jgi:dolichol-phosphate mannosyltransferase
MHATAEPWSIVIPARNEAEGIGEVLRDIRAHLPPQVTEHEVLVIDDGSTDDTARRVQAAASGDPAIRLLPNAPAHGYGAALRRGIGAARFETIVYIDGDGQFDFRDAAALVAALDGADVVGGVRMGRRDAAWRRALASAGGLLARRLLGIRCRDIDAGFKALRASAARTLDSRCTTFLFWTEFYLLGLARGLVFAECPVSHRDRVGGHGKNITPRRLCEALGEVLAHRRNFRPLQAAGGGRA